MSDPSTYNILFLCTGNTCRSPMAEALARRSIGRRGWEHVRVASAGIAAAHGDPASEGAVLAARADGLNLSEHRSQPITHELLDWADLILTMGTSHLTLVRQLGGASKASLLGDFAAGGDGEGDPVPDPFGAELPVYQSTLATLEQMVEKSLDRIEPIIQP